MTSLKCTTIPFLRPSPALSPTASGSPSVTQTDSSMIYATHHLAIAAVPGVRSPMFLDPRLPNRTFAHPSFLPRCSAQPIHFPRRMTPEISADPLSPARSHAPDRGRLLWPTNSLRQRRRIAAQISALDRPDECFLRLRPILTRLIQTNDALHLSLHSRSATTVPLKQDFTHVAVYLLQPLRLSTHPHTSQRFPHFSA